MKRNAPSPLVLVGFDFHNNFSLLFDYQGRFFQQDAQLHLGTVKASWRWKDFGFPQIQFDHGISAEGLDRCFDC